MAAPTTSEKGRKSKSTDPYKYTKYFSIYCQDDYGVKNPSYSWPGMPEGSFQYQDMNYEPWYNQRYESQGHVSASINNGVGSRNFRLTSSDGTNFVVPTERAATFAVVRDMILKTQMKNWEDTTKYQIAVGIDCPKASLACILDYIVLHEKDVDRITSRTCIQALGSLDVDPELGKTPPFTDIEPRDQKFLAALVPRWKRAVSKNANYKYYMQLLIMFRASQFLPLKSLEELLVKYLTNMLHGKKSRQIWKLFRLIDCVPAEHVDDPVKLEHLLWALERKEMQREIKLESETEDKDYQRDEKTARQAIRLRSHDDWNYHRPLFAQQYRRHRRLLIKQYMLLHEDGPVFFGMDWCRRKPKGGAEEEDKDKPNDNGAGTA